MRKLRFCSGCDYEYGYAMLYYKHAKETMKEYIEVLKNEYY